MITAVIPQPGAHHGHAVNRIAHQITTVEASVITLVLASQGIHVEITEPDGVGIVHVWAKHAIGTEGEVRVLRAVEAVTDSQLAYHEVAAS